MTELNIKLEDRNNNIINDLNNLNSDDSNDIQQYSIFYRYQIMKKLETLEKQKKDIESEYETARNNLSKKFMDLISEFRQKEYSINQTHLKNIHAINKAILTQKLKTSSTSRENIKLELNGILNNNNNTSINGSINSNRINNPFKSEFNSNIKPEIPFKNELRLNDNIINSNDDNIINLPVLPNNMVKDMLNNINFNINSSIIEENNNKMPELTHDNDNTKSVDSSESSSSIDDSSSEMINNNNNNIHKNINLSFKCNVCNEVFNKKSLLTIHMNIHNNIMPYKCSKCHKCFKQETSYKKHMKIHANKDKNKKLKK